MRSICAYSILLCALFGCKSNSKLGDSPFVEPWSFTLEADNLPPAGNPRLQPSQHDVPLTPSGHIVTNHPSPITGTIKPPNSSGLRDVELTVPRRCCNVERDAVDFAYSACCQAPFTTRGVNSFGAIFSDAVARGIENATIRAMNATQINSSCEPIKQKPQTDNGQLDLGMSLPIIFWNQGTQQYVQLDDRGRWRPYVPSPDSLVSVRRNLVTGRTTVEDGAGRVRTYDANTIPPRALWWNLVTRTFETTDEFGEVIAVNDVTKSSLLGGLRQGFDVEFDDATSATSLTHRDSRTTFIFKPVAADPASTSNIAKQLASVARYPTSSWTFNTRKDADHVANFSSTDRGNGTLFNPGRESDGIR